LQKFTEKLDRRFYNYTVIFDDQCLNASVAVWQF